MTTEQAPAGPSTSPGWLRQIRESSTLPLIVLTAIVILFGIIAPFAFPGAGHWMEGPAIATLVIFMPLTAISYLHFRLPKKKEDFKGIQKVLRYDKETVETFSIDFESEHSSADYLLPIMFVCFFSALGFYMLFTNNAAVLFNGLEWVQHGSTGIFRSGGKLQYDTQTYRASVVAISISFLGAYIWSIQYIFRRMMTLDLPPGAYYSVASRMVFSVFLAVILQHFINDNAGSVQALGELGEAAGDADALAQGRPGGQLLAVSFLVGIFPERALAWMRETLGHIFTRKSIAAKELPLEMLEGISSFHKARLSELGIDNIQNLAQASLMELILKTPFGPRVLVDWMAQARLCLEFKNETGKIRDAGVRTILDLLEIDADETLLEALAQNSGIELSLIKTVCHANRDEESIRRLRHAYDALNMI